MIVSGSVRIIDPVGLVTKLPGKKSCASPLEEPATLDYFSRDYVDRVHHQLRQIDALGLGDA